MESLKPETVRLIVELYVLIGWILAIILLNFVLPPLVSVDPEHQHFNIEWNLFNLGKSSTNACALKLVGETKGQFRYNRFQGGWKALFIEGEHHVCCL